MITYLDTSVLLPFYFPEELSAKIDDYLERVEGPAVSNLVELEFCSAISKKIRMNEISKTEAQKIIAQFNNHLKEQYFKRFTLSSSHYREAKKLINEFSTPLRTLDALQIAVSSQCCDLLVTSDIKLGKACRAFGVNFKLL